MSFTAFAVARCASSSVTKAHGAIIEFALVSKLPDANFLDYRGVAKVVSRQFRVLETVGSSPAASTKKSQTALAVVCDFFVVARAWSTILPGKMVGSHSPRRARRARS